MSFFRKFDFSSKTLSGNGNYVDTVLDEVCLEGLDGITFESLLIRLKFLKEFLISSEEQSGKEFIFQVLRHKLNFLSKKEYDENSDTIRVFLLDEDRIPLVLYDRYEHTDHEWGVCIEPDNVPEDPYPFALVDDKGVKGSCTTFSSRKDITRRFVDGDVDTLDKMEATLDVKKVVFVASQRMRARALLGPNHDPLLASDLTPMQWCIMERIGRARFQGEMTHGKLSLNFTKETPKTLFYHRKVLVRRNLITKQIHYLKIRGQNFQGLLLHLPRFYVERRSKSLSFTYAVVNLLKSKPAFAASYEDINDFLGKGHYKKLYQNPDFKKFVRSDVKIPLRILKPDAPEKSFMCKGNREKEKTIRCVQLIDPDVDPDVILQGGSKEDENDDDDDDAQDCHDRSKWRMDRSIFWQAYQTLDEAGPEGITQIELGKRMGVNKLDARCFVRNLIRRGVASSFMKDSGRQRVTCFVARRFHDNSVTNSEIEKEKKKHEGLTRVDDEDLPETSAPDLTDDGSRKTLPEEISPSDKMDKKSFVTRGGIQIEVSENSSANRELNTPKKKHFESSSNSQTVRRLRRSNTILEAVRLYKVIDDPTKLYKLIADNEKKEGFDGKMDRKSLHRILSNLADQGHIKNIRIKLKFGQKTKELLFICDPNIDESHTIIQSALEQAKMKLNIVPKERAAILSSEEMQQLQNFSTEDSSIGRSLQEMQDMQKALLDKPPKVVLCKHNGKKYGVKPKFLRMQEFHLLLFYLCRAYNGELITDYDAFIKHQKDNGIDLSEETEDELRGLSIYQKEVSWKMFISPLPVHQGWSDGWCLMCDVLLRLPLSIFVTIVNVTVKIDGIEEYLDHPIRKHYLVKTLPPDIRNKLLFHRKYIFTAFELATRLAFIGVVQFGPQKLKEKDQIFLYLNTKASLYDTTTSAKGYHQVEEKEYDKRTYKFERMEDLVKYWYDMHEICFYTLLGGSATMTGKEITLEVMEKKPALLAAIEARKNEEAMKRDNGDIPGDHLGSGGLDSSMFSHLKRNWLIQSTGGAARTPSNKRPSSTSGHEHDSLIPKKRVKLENVEKVKITLGQTPGKRPMKVSNFGNKASTLPAKDVPKSLPFVPGTKMGKPKAVKRLLVKRKSTPRVPYYDETDKKALKLMRKLRVDWNSEEDSFLLLCKVAGSYLCQNMPNHMAPCGLVRDLLHKRFPATSLNKTSRACQRRLTYMLKNPTTIANVTLFYADLQQDQEVRAKFKIPKRGSLSKEENEARVKRDFEILVGMLTEKYKTRNKFTDTDELPDTIEELEKKFNIIQPTFSIGPQSGFEDPKSIEEIQGSVIHSMILSSLNSHFDKSNWAFQMFKIYQQYPDALLRSTMNKLRSDKMVSLKKHFDRTRIKTGTYLPLSTSPYQLSVNFLHKLLNRYQYEIYSQSWGLLKGLVEERVKNPICSKGLEVVVNHEGGFAATIVSLFAKQKISFRAEVPEQIVVLDPNLSTVDEQYVRILQRYKELLRNADSIETEDSELIEASSFEATKSKAGPTKKELTLCDFLRKDKETLTGSEATSSVGDLESKTVTSSTGVAKRKLPDPAESSASAEKRKKTNSEPSSEAREAFQEGIIFRESPGTPEESRSGVLVAKSASRLALYMMREEMKDDDDKLTVQHTHDYFVISSCQVSCKLMRGDDLQSGESTTIKSASLETLKVPKALLPANVDNLANVLNRLGVGINGFANNTVDKLKKTCLPKQVVTFDFYSKNLAENDDERSIAGAIYQQIEKSKEKGLTGDELRLAMTSQPIDDVTIEIHLKKMIEEYLIVKTGVVSLRFVATIHAKPWILRSFKILRIKTRENLPNIKGAGKLMDVSEHAEEPGAEVSIPGHSSRSKINVDNKISEASENVDWDNVDIVDILIRPWLRIDGTLNRRVLDRLLGAILGCAMHRPGISIEKISEKLSPALMPVHIRELLEILAEIGCIQLQKLVRRGKPGLFTKSLLPQLTKPSILDDNKCLVVEPTVDAIIKLGQFIGDKLYTTNIYDCPCHPI